MNEVSAEEEVVGRGWGASRVLRPGREPGLGTGRMAGEPGDTATQLRQGPWGRLTRKAPQGQGASSGCRLGCPAVTRGSRPRAWVMGVQASLWSRVCPPTTQVPALIVPSQGPSLNQETTRGVTLLVGLRFMIWGLPRAVSPNPGCPTL